MGPYKLRGRCQERDILFEYKNATGTSDWAPLYDGIPIRCKEPDPMTVTQVTVTKDIAFVADDGARISFDVTTGLWNDLDPFGVSYDGNACQDYIGLIAMYIQPWGFSSPVDAGSLRLQTYNGTIIDWPMGTGYRFNSGCAGPFSWGKLWYNAGPSPKQMPGIWGGQTKLKNFNTGPLSGGSISAQQVGNQVVITGSGTAIFRPTFNFDVE
jgi:hypothetical protein